MSTQGGSASANTPAALSAAELSSFAGKNAVAPSVKIDQIEKLRGSENYATWSVLFEAFRELNSTKGFIDGTITRPADLTNDEGLAWLKANKAI